ncbi:MAG TPA: peptide ABC transporter substrate-binding protein [Phycisphaerales bacterium]|nr:peptide ABC transporter substrate-binding protein [Phycisphaerales bacterium]HIN83665.1 peptide ABC transporter substrate-binding protein [Phycisphaerales bacterium]HIO19611.1 peptide ABC transporter substrate-binding protein [Phycisphaerales bacterium]HIO52160.1 peptide ABC transporter substrate-binding protein [Phycisphaerales bacterium]
MYRLLVPVAFVVAVVVCIVGFERTRPRADFVFVSSGDVFTLDPQRMSWLSDLQIGYCLYEGLVRWNTEDFSIEPAAAEQYEISDDGLEYIFHLRNDARWSNGASVTAHDFRYAWMRLLTPDTASDYSSFFYSISGAKEYWDLRTKQLQDGTFVTLEELEESFGSIVEIKVVDTFTLKVKLDLNVPYFLDQIALAVCSPVYKPAVEGWAIDDSKKKLVVENGWYSVEPPTMENRRFVSLDKESGRIKQKYTWARPGNIICNGPFVLDEWRYKRDMWLVRNPHYHSPSITTINTIQGITIADANTAVLAFEGGQADWLSSVNVEYQSDMLRQKDEETRTNIHAFPTFGTDFFSFNCRPTLVNGKLNPFSNAGVRRAFVLATNREVIVKHATRLNEPTVTSFVPPNSIVGYGNVEGLGFDPERAKEELALAGWRDRDGDGVLENADGTLFPPIDLLYTTNTPRYKWISLELRDQWKKNLGVRVELRGTDNKFFSSDLHSGNFMIARGRWYGDYGDPTTFLDVFKSDNGNNDRGFVSIKIDAALNEAALERDPDKRMEMLRSIEEELFTEEVPMLVICQLLQLYMYEPSRVTGLTSHPRLVQHLWRVNVAD